ncbi:N-glycosyltransferase [Clostridium puniceum]|uniref:N-glycosyltransferase n=1 Tax=Clostridium puniceum TaxID=29367 RepID=A0A1S8TUP1_9CLOT|nr:glycosyltransferase [Clostridium puniceum]OOM81533.1 N-glycosyltransferase [Clostridium puniceum]
MNVSFVILHYMTLEDTKECIESIEKNIDYDDYSIIIVDNASPNNTGKVLLTEYASDNKVTVIINDKNLGFAKGNNIGFKYAKHEKKSDFIIMMNNDTIIEQFDFCDKIIELYNKEEFHILGPDIISTKDGGHQNPIKNNITLKSDFKKTIIKHRIQLILNYLFIEKYLTKLKKKILNKDSINEHRDIYRTINNCVLHGSCLIFSKKYIDRFDGIYKNTFMYGEEEILFYLCNQMNLKWFYLPELKINHKEASSTSESISLKQYKKKRFFYINKIKSCKNILNDLKRCKNIEKLLSD